MELKEYTYKKLKYSLPDIEWEQILEGEKVLTKLENYVDIITTERDVCEELYNEYGKELRYASLPKPRLELLKKQIGIKKESIKLSDEIQSKKDFIEKYKEHLWYNKSVYAEWETRADTEMAGLIEKLESVVKTYKETIPLPMLSKNIDLLVNVKKGFPDKKNLVKAFKTLINNYNDLVPFINK